MNREFLMLAKPWNRDRDSLLNCYVSEKLDGQRCLWDGGVTRGMNVKSIPFANTVKDKKEVISTGLWSRYGKVIQAPGWFLDMLPDVVMDGELYLGRGRFEETMSIIGRDTPDERWKSISYKVFDLPGMLDVLLPGRINNLNFKKQMDCLSWASGVGFKLEESRLFDYNVIRMGREFRELWLPQERLPLQRDLALGRINEFLGEVDSGGGEGLMLRHAGSTWFPKRVDSLLKIKTYSESIGLVISVSPGEGKHAGRMGSLEVRVGEITCSVGTGFSDQDRARLWKVGDRIEIKHKGFTHDGKLREASYLKIVE